MTTHSSITLCGILLIARTDQLAPMILILLVRHIDRKESSRSIFITTYCVFCHMYDVTRRHNLWGWPPIAVDRMVGLSDGG